MGASPEAPQTLPHGVVVRDLDAERVLLGTALDGRRIRPAAVEAYASAVQERLNARGLVIVTGRGTGDLLGEIAEEMLDVGGWATVLGYSHPQRSAEVRSAANQAVCHAARGWQAIERARWPR
ncbi:MAG: hypothetical protein QM679_08210 [Patulibacter sp.]